MYLMIIMVTLITMISLFLMLINFLISMKKKNNREKLSPFECGFDPMSSSRLPFSMHFYMISIMFLIFDVEIIIFFPMIPSFIYSSIESNFYTTYSFIFILLLGLYIEWNDGALIWLK